MISNGTGMVYARSWGEGLRRVRIGEMSRAGQIQEGCCPRAGPGRRGWESERAGMYTEHQEDGSESGGKHNLLN